MIKDTTKPVVTITALKTKASKNKVVKGKVRDNRAAASVSVKVIEKRGSSWYAFTGTKWVKKASKTKAWKAAKLRTDKSVSSGAWSLPLKKLTKGTVVVQYFAKDTSGNKSTTKTYKKKVTS